MIKKIQRAFASSRQGAVDLIKGIIACAFQNISFILPTALLYFIVSDLINGGVPAGKTAFYVIGCIVCIAIIFIATWFQYNDTYFATYIESGKRRISLAENLRKLPLSCLLYTSRSTGRFHTCPSIRRTSAENTSPLSASTASPARAARHSLWRTTSAKICQRRCIPNSGVRSSTTATKMCIRDSSTQE